MSKKIVIALGGNAILRPGQKGLYEEQVENVYITCKQIADMSKNGYKIVVTHGNGPQVGNILIQNDSAKDTVPVMPLEVCGAESQGMIGYMIQQNLRKVFAEKNMNKQIATILTQVEVDENDNAFKEPSKPVGMFYTEEEAKKEMIEKGEKWIEDSGRGWRKVVPSPKPKDIVEKDIIKMLFEKEILVVASGGGGIPVIKKDNASYVGVEAVIDKDWAAEKLAYEIDADILVILTDVSNVMINYKQENEKKLGKITLEEAKKYMQEGHFKKGSMGPKVSACISFVEKTNKKAIITSLENALKALEGEAGTIFTSN